MEHHEVGVEVGFRVTNSQTRYVKEIRLLGTTWKDRGPPYWARRVGLVVLWTAVFALSCWGVGLVIYVIATSASGSARAFILVLAATGVLWSFYWGFGLLKRTDEEKELGVPMIIRSGTTPEARDLSV